MVEQDGDVDDNMPVAEAVVDPDEDEPCLLEEIADSQNGAAGLWSK